MQDSRLFTIFQHLTKKELRALDKFVQSPFHNQRQDVIQLFFYLRKLPQPVPNRLLEKEFLFSHIFPNEDYKEKKIRYTMSFLYQTIKNFLAIENFQNRKTNIEIAVVQAFRKKGIPQLFEQAWQIANQHLEKSDWRQEDYHFQKYLLQNERYLFTTSQTRREIVGLEEYAVQLDHFFIINKLRQAARTLSHKTIITSAFEPTFLPEILAYLQQKNHLDNPAIAIYYHCYKILEAENALPYFQQLRKLVANHSLCFPTRELQDIYMFALNYCIKRLNAQEMAFGSEALALYKEGLRQKIFLENGVLSRFNYKNIVALGIGNKDFAWVENFIEAYKPYLEKKHRQSTYYYNLAMLHYRRGEHEKTMELLQKVKSKDVLINLDTRRILTCIYYDLEELEVLQSLLDSFQNYIYRKPGLGYHKKMYLNFIKYVRKLLQKEGMSNSQLGLLKKEIEDTRNIAEKEWLLGHF